MRAKRRHERYDVATVGINGKMLLAKFLKILNISIGGICFQTEKRLNPGSQYSIKLEGKGRILDLQGVVVWSTLRESMKDARGNIVPIYTAGMKFMDVSDEKVTAIVGFIGDHRRNGDKELNPFASSGLRLFVRIRIENPESAVLDYHCRVKNLGLGGVLIESAHAIELEKRLPMDLTLTEDASIEFIGRVAYSREVIEGDTMYHDIGVDIVEMSEKDTRVLHEFINSLKASEGVSAP